MKAAAYLLTVFTIFFLLVVPAAASETADSFDKMSQDFTAELIDELDENTKKVLTEFGLKDMETDSMLNLSIKDIAGILKEELTFNLKESFSSFYKILALLLILVLINSVKQNTSAELIDDIYLMVSVLVISLITTDCVKLLAAVFSLTAKFMTTLIPVITVMLSLTGNVTFSALYSTMMVGFCQVLAFFTDDIITAFAGIYFGLIISMNFNEITDAEKIAAFINSAASAVLGSVSTIFSLLLSAKNLLAKDVDSVLFHSGKFLISSVIPVVGGAVSSALSSVIGSLSIVRSTIGIFAIIAAVCINLPLFIKVITCRISLGAITLLSSAFGEKRVSGMINSVSKSLRLLLILAFFELFTVIISTGLAVSIRSSVQ